MGGKRLTDEELRRRGDEMIQTVREGDPEIPINKLVKRSRLKAIEARIPGFKDRWAAVLKETGRRKALHRGFKQKDPQHEANLEVWLKHFAVCGNMREACEKASEECNRPVYTQQISKRINPSDRDFDPVFYERYARAESNAIFQIEDALKGNALTPTDRFPHGDVNAQRIVLEARHPGYLRRQRVEHAHVHTGTVELKTIHMDLEQSSKEMFSGRVVELDKADVELLE